MSIEMRNRVSALESQLDEVYEMIEALQKKIAELDTNKPEPKVKKR